MAAEQAAYWGALAMPEEAFMDCAKRAVSAYAAGGRAGSGAEVRLLLMPICLSL